MAEYFCKYCKKFIKEKDYIIDEMICKKCSEERSYYCKDCNYWNRQEVCEKCKKVNDKF